MAGRLRFLFADDTPGERLVGAGQPKGAMPEHLYDGHHPPHPIGVAVFR